MAKKATKVRGGPRGVAILGGGNLGSALARGWVAAGRFTAGQVAISDPRPARVRELQDEGFTAGSSNLDAVLSADIVILAVQPKHAEEVLEEITPHLDAGRHRILSVVSGLTIEAIESFLDDPVPVARVMPNTAVMVGESMTCLSPGSSGSERALADAQELFGLVGRTLVIEEEMLIPATALCSSGIAFFLRFIRAAAQAGVEIGFHPEEAAQLAAQTAKGAAALGGRPGTHLEAEIDRVTTPGGCTIAGLNEMESHGVSSAIVQGILAATEAAAELYSDDD